MLGALPANAGQKPPEVTGTKYKRTRSTTVGFSSSPSFHSVRWVDVLPIHSPRNRPNSRQANQTNFHMINSPKISDPCPLNQCSPLARIPSKRILLHSTPPPSLVQFSAVLGTEALAPHLRRPAAPVPSSVARSIGRRGCGSEGGGDGGRTEIWTRMDEEGEGERRKEKRPPI